MTNKVIRIEDIQYTGEVLHGYLIHMKPHAAWRKELLSQTPPDCKLIMPSDQFLMAEGKRFNLFPSRNEAMEAYGAKNHDFTQRYDVYIEEVQITTSVINKMDWIG